jgi:site-specific DNA-adenine methylase
MKLNRFIINYKGNKYLEAKKHLKNEILEFKNYDIICEPLCGIFGFSRAFLELNPDFKGEIWLNDFDNNLINSIKDIKDKPIETINKLKEEINKYKLDKDLSNDKQKSYLLKNVSLVHNDTLCSKEKFNTKINNYIEKIDDYKIFFNKVKLFNLEFNDFIKKLPKNKKILIFLDPPYFNSSNSSYDTYVTKEEANVVYKDGTKIYIDIYELFKNKKKNIKIIMIINKITFINYFFKNWFYKTFNGFYQSTNKNIKIHNIYLK